MIMMLVLILIRLLSLKVSSVIEEVNRVVMVRIVILIMF